MRSLMFLVPCLQPMGSRIERVRTITGVLEQLREMEAGPEPHSMCPVGAG